MSKFHGYTQRSGAHHVRPWWRAIGALTWERHDGHRVTWQPARNGNSAILLWHADTGQVAGRRDTGRVAEWAMAHIDSTHPLPPPAPACGQVWVWPENSKHIGPETPWGAFMVQAMVTGFDTSTPLLGGYPQVEWPPPGAVLVAGEGAPWAPMGGANE